MLGSVIKVAPGKYKKESTMFREKDWRSDHERKQSYNNSQTTAENIAAAAMVSFSNGISYEVVGAEPPELSSVFVGRLANDCDDKILRAHFAGFGQITQCRVPHPGGHGYVSFSSHDEAELAIAHMHGQYVGPNIIRINWRNVEEKITKAIKIHMEFTNCDRSSFKFDKFLNFFPKDFQTFRIRSKASRSWYRVWHPTAPCRN